MNDVKETPRGKVRQLELLRAKRAHEAVSKAAGELGADATVYRQAARSAGEDIMTNGLGQTLAFWFSKRSKPAYKMLNADVSAWVLEEMRGISVADDADTELLDWITTSGRTRRDYQRSRAETVAFLVWLKRYAEALITADKPVGEQ